VDHDARLLAAEAFLQEAVYRSRGAQAGASLLAPDERLPDGGQCGLGARAAVVLDLSPRAELLFEQLWPEGVSEEQLPAIQECMRLWVERQDALDRKRNHFMKEFRGQHGFDRGAYDEARSAAYRAGLDAVNGEVTEVRREVARGLLLGSEG
jgi:hypothetical protein